MSAITREPGLTERQTKVLNAFRASEREGAGSPSYREVMARTGLTSIGGVCACVERLIAQGFLARVHGAARNVKVVDRFDGRGEWASRLSHVPDAALKEVLASRHARPSVEAVA